ncbi:hypothetical protein LXA43DRAFT_838405, partial [Ganoderma leucocontextum]
MIGCRFLAQISETLCEAKGVSDKPFGGINVVLAGDFAQLSPIGDTRLYSWVNPSKRAHVSGRSAMDTVIGKLLWLSFDTCVMLTEVMRQSGDANKQFVDLLARLRLGRCTQDDFDVLNSRVIDNLPSQRDLSPWTSAPVVVKDNATKDAINRQGAEAFARKTNQRLHYYYATD